MASTTNGGDAWGNYQTFPTNLIGTTPAAGWWRTSGVTPTFTATNDGITNGVGGLGSNYYAGNIGYVPEPSAALLGGLGMLALLRRRR